MELYNRRTSLLLAIIFGLSLGSVGCSQQGGSNAEPGKATGEQLGRVIATVNGEAITENELERYRMAQADSDQEQNSETLLNGLITQTLVYQDALRKNLDKDPKVVRELDQLRTRILASMAVRRAIDDNPVTDEELREQYEQLKADLVVTEYKASHILVEEEEQARELIAQLDGGADFAELARDHSTGPSGENGGDLGWVNPQQMVPPFSQALQQMETATYSKEPVNTQFGWHVIKLDDSRQSDPPSFEALKEQLAQMARQSRIGEYFEALREKADISITKTAEGHTSAGE